jgi:hypothetical protein
MATSSDLSNKLSCSLMTWCTMAIADCCGKIPPSQIKSHIVATLDSLLSMVDQEDLGQGGAKITKNDLEAHLETFVPSHVQHEFAKLLESSLLCVVLPALPLALVNCLDTTERRCSLRHLSTGPSYARENSGDD